MPNKTAHCGRCPGDKLGLIFEYLVNSFNIAAFPHALGTLAKQATLLFLSGSVSTSATVTGCFSPMMNRRIGLVSRIASLNSRSVME
jgi:hypothetical protein